MKITEIQPSICLINPARTAVFTDLLRTAEYAGRTCYKTEERHIDVKTAGEFLGRIIEAGHESVIEHMNVTFHIICDRSCSHQIVRHRLVSYSQESQRYCNYGKLGFQVICPPVIKSNNLRHIAWKDVIRATVGQYCYLLDSGVKPEDARSVLPNAMKTELVMTANIREWRHIFEERALNPRAQWQIRGLMQDALEILFLKLPAIFEDQHKKLQLQTGIKT